MTKREKKILNSSFKINDFDYVKDDLDDDTMN